MRTLPAALALSFAFAACSGTSESGGDITDFVDAVSEQPDCESITKGFAIPEDFSGCLHDETIYVTFVWDCDDGRQMVGLGDPGDPWHGWGYLGGTFETGEAPLFDRCFQ